MAQQPLLCQGVLIIEASRLHSKTPQFVGLLWKSDQPDAKSYTWQHTDLQGPGGIRTRNRGV